MNIYVEKNIFTVFYIVLGVIFIIGIISNLLSLVFVSFNKRTISITKKMSLNLALADLLVILVCIPTTIYKKYSPFAWIFGDIGCKLSIFTQGVSVSVSILTLTVISIDRYIIVCKPFTPRSSYTNCKVNLIVLFIWIVSSLFNIPLLIVAYNETNYHKNISTDFYYSFCHENWTTYEKKLIFETCNIVFLFLIPLIIISFTLACLTKKLWKGRAKFEIELTTKKLPTEKRSTSSPLNSRKEITSLKKQDKRLNLIVKSKESLNRTKSSASQRQSIESGYERLCQRRKRIVKLVFILCLLFTISWLPYHLVFYSSEILIYLKLKSDPEMNDTKLIEFLNTKIHPYTTCLAFSNSAFNGILFCFFNSSFKRFKFCSKK